MNPNALVLDNYHAELGEDWDPEHLNAVFILNVCAVAALTWVVYDFILSIGDEISLVWNRWNNKHGKHARRLYVVVRYFSIINLCCYVAVNLTPGLTRDFCSAWYYILVVNATVITLAPDAMILLRINAVYHWDTFVLALTSTLFAIQMVTSIVVGMVIMGSADIQGRKTALPVPGCSFSFNHHPKLSLAAWIPSLAAQCVYFILMLVTLVHVMRGLDVRGRASADSLHQVRKLVPTMMVFITHGTYYFSFAILTKIVNAILVVTATGPLREVGIPWMMAIYPVLVTNVYLNMVQYLRGRRGRVQFLHEAPRPGDAAGAAEGGLGVNQDDFFFDLSFNSSSDNHIHSGLQDHVDEDRDGRRNSARFRTALGQMTFAARSSLAIDSDELLAGI